MSRERGECQKAKLLLIIPIPHSTVVVRVRKGALDVYILNREDPKGIGPLGKVGDMNLCQKH